MKRVFIIAEIGSVHDGSFGNAQRLVDAAADARVDAVKFQTHIAEAETLRDAKSPPYFKAEPRFEYFTRTGFQPEQWERLAAHCRERGVEFMSSPFSEEAVDLLEGVGMHRYKIPSGEVTNVPMLEKIAGLGKPVILSSGMSSWGELDRAVDVFRRTGTELGVMQCTSEYPCPPERVGLNVMLEMQRRYGVPVGLSDHTVNPFASLAAVSLGATLIERHLAFSRLMYGSDAKHSLLPDELADLVRGIREVEVMLATKVDKDNLDRLLEMKSIFEKSVVVLSPVSAGSAIPRAALGIRKPGTGIPAARLADVVGRRAARDLAPGRVLVDEDLAP